MLFRSCTLIEPGGARTDFRRSARLACEFAAYDRSPSRMVSRIVADKGQVSPGDPAKMVEAMIASVDEEPAPRRIALGSDAYRVMHAQLSARLAALEAQKDLACATDASTEGDSAASTSWFATADPQSTAQVALTHDR